MTLIFFGLGMSFLVSLGLAAFRARNVFSRKSSMGCIIATATASILLVLGLQNPSVKNAQWLKQAGATQTGGENTPLLLRAKPARPSNPDLQAATQRASKVAPPVKIIDVYSAASAPSAPTTSVDPTEYLAKIQSHLLNNQFDKALQLYQTLTTENFDLPEQTQQRWETQALRQIRPIPASNVTANRNGYLFLAALRPDEPEYRAKVERYSQ